MGVRMEGRKDGGMEEARGSGDGASDKQDLSQAL